MDLFGSVLLLMSVMLMTATVTGQQTLTEWMASQGDLSQWNALLNANPQKAALLAMKGFVVPTNQALTTFNYRYNQTLDPKDLVAQYTTGSYTTLDTATTTMSDERDTADGTHMYIRKVNNVLRVNGGAVVREQVLANQAKAFVVDAVMSSKMSDLQTILASPKFSKFSTLLKDADKTLYDAVQMSLTFKMKTVFLPTNEAMSKIPPAKDPAASPMKKAIVDSHFLDALFFESDLAPNQELTSTKQNACKPKILTEPDGKLLVECGLVTARITSAILLTKMVAVYEIDRLLNYVYESAYDQIQANSNLGEFKKLLSRVTGDTTIRAMLESGQQTTVFAPINSAFIGVDLNQQADLVKIVKCQIHSTNSYSVANLKSLVSSGNGQLQTMDPTVSLKVALTDSGMGVTLQKGASPPVLVSTGDYGVTTGFVHHTNGLFCAAKHTIMVILESHQNINVFVGLLKAVGLDAMLQNDTASTYNVFALPNERIATLNQQLAANLKLSTKNLETTKEYLRSFIVKGPKINLACNNSPFNAVNGYKITISCSKEFGATIYNYNVKNTATPFERLNDSDAPNGRVFILAGRLPKIGKMTSAARSTTRATSTTIAASVVMILAAKFVIS
ncbi:uncharacterized protein LOC141914127 [Tubulanus polymorphus]|uniref:uncharacterized protein LOC141914127 n=1 Tax=Tubulanus polymorphus TaxID=672921 RepID=UPI003DA5DD0A